MLKVSKKIAFLLKEINDSLKNGEVVGYREHFPTNSYMETMNAKFIVVKGINYTAGEIFWSTETIKKIKKHHFNLLKMFVGLSLQEQKELLNKLVTFLEIYDVLGFLRSPGLSRNPTASGFTLVPEGHVDQSVKDFVKETFKEVIADGYNDVVKEFSWWLKHGLRNNDDNVPQQDMPTPKPSTNTGEEEPVQVKETADDKHLCSDCILKTLTENVTSNHASPSELTDEKSAKKLPIGIDLSSAFIEKITDLCISISGALVEAGATASEDEETFKARIKSLNGLDPIVKSNTLSKLYHQRTTELYRSLQAKYLQELGCPSTHYHLIVEKFKDDIKK